MSKNAFWGGARRRGCGSSGHLCGRSARHRGSPSAKTRNTPYLFGVLAVLLWLLLSPPHAPSVVVRAASSAASSSNVEPVYLLNTMYSVDKYSELNAEAIRTGMDIAFYASGCTVGDNRSLVIVEPPTDAVRSDVVDVIEKGLRDYPTLMGVLGPYSDASTIAALKSSVVKQNHLVCLTPFTQSSTVRVWSDNVYFTRADPSAELKVIVSYIINHLAAKRIAYMYLRGAYYGFREYRLLQKMLTRLNRNGASLYVARYSTTDFDVNTAAFNAMASRYPQAVIVWGTPGKQTFEFVRRVMLDPRTSSAAIFGCLALQQTLHDAYVNVTAEGVPGDRIRVFSSATSLPPTDYDISIECMKHFRDELTYYVGSASTDVCTLQDGLRSTEAAAAAAVEVSDSASLQAAAREFLSQKPVAAQMMMVVGWLGAKIVQQTLERVDWIKNRSTYQAGLFSQNRYIVGVDCVFGDYGGPCNHIAAATGAMCECNQGGHIALLMRFVNGSGWNRVIGTYFTYPQTTCYSTDVALPKPLNVVVFSSHSKVRLIKVTDRLIETIPNAFMFLSSTEVSLNMIPLNASSTTQQAVLDMEVRNYTVDVLTGPLAEDLNVDDLLVLEPAFGHQRRWIAKRNFIYLMPTLAQEVYILYANLPTIAAVTGVSPILHVVLHGFGDSETAEIVDLLSKTADTFGYDDPTITNVAFDDEATATLSPTEINLFLGIGDGDSVIITTFLANDPSAIVVVDYDDFSLSHPDFQILLEGLEPSVQRRFLSFTNMPLWTDTSAEAHAASPLLELFHQMLPDPVNHTTAHLEGFICAAFLQQLAMATEVINSTNLVNTLYRKSTLSFYEMTFGKFDWSCSTTASGQTCDYNNYGAQNIVVFSMERVLDPKVPVTVEATTPAMLYTTTRNHGGKLSPAQLAGIITGSVVGVLLLIVAILAVVFCCFVDARNNATAPKAAQEPVTIVFTDIESSTALWAALPQLMPEAVATHHRVIRSCVKKHGCYEVKTIGDSFMIACKDASSAVALAAEIQTRLLDCDWATEEIDEAYRRFELQRAQEEGGEPPHSAQLRDDVYNSLWRGLRVRMGIHTGLCDIRLDEVTKGFDYYGDTSNMAARTEAIANGGQVIVTEATWWALSDATRGQLAVTRMGPQGLRGVPYAVEMYQLDPVPGRRHARLRTEIEAFIPDDAATDTVGSTLDGPMSSHTNMSSTAVAVASVLASCFSTYPPAQRIRELQPLLLKWRVSAPPRHSGVSAEDYCQTLFNRLAVRVGRVTEARLRLNGNSNGAELNLLNSMGGSACVQRNPLCRNSNCRQQDSRRDASRRITGQPTISGFHELFQPSMSRRLSLHSSSQQERGCSDAPQEQGGVTVLDLSHDEP